MNRLKKIFECGQSVWLDNLARPILTDGTLQKLIEEDAFIEHAEFSGNMYGTSKQAVKVKALSLHFLFCC